MDSDNNSLLYSASETEKQLQSAHAELQSFPYDEL